MAENYNVPAFPTTPGAFLPDSDGMTLRDYFAAKVMQSLCSDTRLALTHPNTQRDVADLAYAIADAMLEARTR
jgi:hypothetical protein